MNSIAAAAAAHNAGEAAVSGRRVLWIRAEAPENAQGEDILRRNGYAVRQATARVEDDPPANLPQADVILLELSHGESNGLTFCRKLGDMHSGALLVIAPRLGVLERVAFLEFGADRVLPNTIHPVELLAEVRAADRRALRPPDREVRYEPEWRFEVMTGNVRSNHGRIVQLSRADTDLLFALAVRAGRLVDRETLVRALHDEKEPVQARSIDARIARLRRALEPCEAGMIRTIRGRGYVWEPTGAFKVIEAHL